MARTLPSRPETWASGAAGQPRLVAIINRRAGLRCARREVARAIHLLDAARMRFRGGCPDGELSIVLLTDKALAQLHAIFLHDPSATDVITFSGNAQEGIAGEICISADAAAAYSREKGTDFSAEMLRYIVHGWLHLSGYDDLRPSLKRGIRRAENRALRLLTAQKCRPRFSIFPRRRRGE